ncbi:hypothetical protein QN277_024820 [Acacia crassicarpa]|uniref:TF-B3 domain-containing protein n=1 Tax=Acacia crassicarpa TaxID=499986 RepID=A0AAE1MPH1_9FABA|nr:hypothetical protein QN277_024820 [Acacia crassicarpa]
MNQNIHKQSHNRPEASTRDHPENWKGKAVIDLEIKEESDQEMWDEIGSSESDEDEEEYEESDDKSHDIGEGSNLGSTPPFFTVKLLASAKKGCMCVPTKFFREHMRNVKQEVEIETAKGVWKVTLLPHRKRTRTFARFSRGWSAFTQSNQLEVGGALLFKMIRRGKCPKFIVQRQSEVSG